MFAQRTCVSALYNMIQQFISQSPEHNDLILIFLGWGADATQLRALHHKGCDIMAVWDYRDDTFDATPIHCYRNIYIFAWSMGVMMAELTLNAHPELRPTICIAVNGSVTPIDDYVGIPRAIFQGTLAGLNEATLKKFQRRMCSSNHEYADYCTVLPNRPIEELRDELRILGERAEQMQRQSRATHWSRAIVAKNDRIFPIENMRRAWSGTTRVRETESAHLPDWATILNQEIIDKEYVASKFQRSAATYDAEAVAQKQIASRLWKMWQQQLGAHTPSSIIEAGCGTGIMTRLYAPALNPKELTLWDLCRPTNELPQGSKLVLGDAEAMIAALPDECTDAIVSASTMQWFNSPGNFMTNAARALTPGGHLVISTFGERNMWELSQITQLPLRYFTLDELISMLPDGMQILTAEQEEIVMHFTSPKEVMRHLRATGVNGIRDAKTPLSSILSNYPVTTAGDVTITYHPIYLIAEKQ
jgi:malonyl-ACP O-methyltransferase BioC